MSFMPRDTAFEAAQTIELLTRERAMSLSLREWKHRLAGYGISIRDTDHGPVVATLRDDTEICALPKTLH